jgi:hypothetical protein
MLRIVKGSLPPHHEEVATPTTFSQAKSRGLSTPAHLMISQSGSPPAETPLLDKRFSWEKSPTTPTGLSTADPSTPLSAFRQSLQKPSSPIAPRPIVHTSTPPRRMSRAWVEQPLGGPLNGYSNDEDEGQMEETPKKTKRWSDQLRGFQSSFAGLGGDDDWGSSLTSALNGDMGLTTVHESQSGGRESIDSERPATASTPVAEMSPSSLESIQSRTKAMVISTTPQTSPPIAKSPRSPTSPGSPSTARDRSRRKPVPLVSPTPRRHSNRSTKSVRTPQSERQWPISPARPPPQVSDRMDLSHSRSQSFPQSQPNDSELDHELRTPSTNEHFPMSLVSQKSADSLLPPLPRSISEESQWTLALAKTLGPVTPPAQKHPWAQFGFTHDSDSPPRPDPRLSFPATARYTESSPPSRSHTPETDADDHPPPLPSPPISPSAYPVRSPRSPRYRKDKDPLSRLDTAERSERASIALSIMSTSASEARSSLNSIRSSYLHEARVLKAFMRDPAELGGLRESDAERDSSTSDDRVGESETDSEGFYARDGDYGGLAGPAVIKNNNKAEREEPIRQVVTDSSEPSSSNPARLSNRNSTSPRSSSSTPRKSPSKRSQKSSIDSTRSRRSHEKSNSPNSPHPFAYRQPGKLEDREDDALLALDDAAREIARQRSKLTPVSSPGKARFDDAEEDGLATFKHGVGRGLHT